MEFDLKSISQFNEATALDADDLVLIQSGNVFKKVKSKNFFGFIEKRLTLSQSEIQNLNTTPVTIIPPQGAGVYLVPAFGAAKLNHNGVSYTSGNSLRLKYIGDLESNYLFSTDNDFINSSESTVQRIISIAGTKKKYSENTGVEVFVDTANPTGAGGTINIYVLFKVIVF